MRARVILLLSTLALSAHADTARWITWAELAQEIAEQNATLLAARAAREVARYNARAAEAAFWPTVSGSAGLSRSDSDDNEQGPSDRSSLGVDARYTLYAGGADRARVRQARAALDRAEAEYAETLAAVGAEARRAYIRLVFAQQRIALAETIVERRRQNLDLVRLRFDGGGENKGSLLRVEAGVRQAEADLAQARRDQPVRQQELSGLAGRDERIAWIARDAMPTAAPAAAPEWGPLLRSIPRVRAAQALVEARRAAVTIARGAIRPELALRGGIDRSGDSWPPDRDSWSVGATLAVPFFTGGRNLNQLAAAQADLRQAEAALDRETRTLRLEIETAYTDLMNAIEQVEVQQAFRDAAEARAEIARAQYANGLLSFQNWDQIEDELIQSQQNLLARARDAALAAAEWDRVRGRSPLPETP